MLRIKDRRTHKSTSKIAGEEKVSQQKTAFLYIRVSTNEQADRGFSQRDQDQRLNEYCQRNNIQVGRVIYEDYSAKTFKRRPEWSKMLTELKKTKGRLCDMILFTKWDRFSRNTANAYEMIDILTALNVTPNAIDQFLDLKVPESRIMLAVYISQAEVDNLRRGLNVAVGMRRGRLEGRWMGKAPAGYINKIREDKTKSIEPLKPEADCYKWAFETLAQGVLNAETVWRLARSRGLKSARVTFLGNIRNPIYCGLVVVPEDENHELMLVKGKHEAIITEDTFWKVQDALNGRKNMHHVFVEPPAKLPLRGFLLCAYCGKKLSGSGSTGWNGIHYYYHCRVPCKGRYKADEVNADFERELRKLVPKAGMNDLYRQVVCDILIDDIENFDIKRKELVTEISDQNNKITKLRAMLLYEEIDSQDYKVMKSECDSKVIRLEAELNKLKHINAEKTDLGTLVDGALIRLNMLFKLYKNANMEEKRFIIGSTFQKQWSISEIKCRTASMNSAVLLIYLINNKLGRKKAGVRSKIRSNSGLVPSAGVEPARFPTGV
ncbi:recombinase family protein [Pedobacter aquatilis]|uniref:recombinase family protein n=1 Tax=Pedobacter aquatilis TaxID=351343 RepID=UPI0039778E54